MHILSSADPGSLAVTPPEHVENDEIEQVSYLSDDEKIKEIQPEALSSHKDSEKENDYTEDDEIANQCCSNIRLLELASMSRILPSPPRRWSLSRRRRAARALPWKMY